MRPRPAIAAEQFGVFTTTQALGAGWTSHALRHAVASGALERLRVGLYTVRSDATETPHERALARQRASAAAVWLGNRRVPVSHRSAAALLDLPLLSVPDEVCVTFPRGRRGQTSGVHRHRGRLSEGDVVRSGRVLMTSPARTMIDIGVRVGHRRRHRHRRGRCGVRLGIATPALESLSLLRIAPAGLPPPRTQVEIVTLDGRGPVVDRLRSRFARPDLPPREWVAWPQARAPR